MSTSARQYRQHLYRLKAHPRPEQVDEPRDPRDSFLTVYFSLLPFVGVEYWIESSSQIIPSGLIFPLGYLLFWAYYYTYYRPDVLEEHLTDPRKYNLMFVPTLLLGVVIWFVKFTIRELERLFFVDKLIQWILKASRPKSQTRAILQRTSRQQMGRPRAVLPPEVVQALAALGLGENASWAQIQHRYRELVKRSHPDHNHNTGGRQFITFVSAYRVLEAFRFRR